MRRASARISSPSDFACPISLRCSSSSLRASSRALSASASAFWIRSRRSSIVAWMRPNASRFRAKKVIRKQMIVQIISPGVTWMSGLAASIVGLRSL